VAVVHVDIRGGAVGLDHVATVGGHCGKVWMDIRE
jgi:hypothetical protein